MRKCYTFLLISLCLTLTALSQNTSLNLTGSNYVSPNIDIVDPNGDFTLEFWAFVPHSAVSGAPRQMVSQGASDFKFTIGLLADTTIQIGNALFYPGTGVKMPVDRWTHVAVYFNSSIGRAFLYLDGKVKATVDGLIFNDDQPFRIGVQTDLTEPFIGMIDELKSWDGQRTQTQIRSDMFGTPNLSDNSLVAYYQMNEGSGINVTNSAATGNSKDGVIHGDDPVGANSWTGSPIQYGNNALVFDGADDQVNIPALAGNQYDLNGGGTVEFWVSPKTLPSGDWATILGVRGPGGVRYSFHLSSTQIGIDNGGPSMKTLDYALPTGDSVWSHLAFVYDGAHTTTVYLNGAKIDTIDASLGSVPGQPLTIGIAKNSAGPDDRAFQGGIDEVRIWNTIRNASQIAANYKSTLQGNESGLIAQFTFDQGVSKSDDSGLKTAFDNTANANDGDLANFALTGTSSNFTAHSLLFGPLPVTMVGFTAIRSGNESILQWQTSVEENTRDFIIERSADGKTYTDIGSVAAAGNSHVPVNYSYTDPQPLPNTNFYRLKQVDLDGNYAFSPVRLITYPSPGRLIWFSTGKTTATVLFPKGNNEFYSVFDAAGRQMQTGRLSNGQTSISHLPPGVYFVRVGIMTTTILLK